MKLVLCLVLLTMTFSFPTLSHEIKLKDITTEEIINTRKKKMSIINKLTQKIYKQLNTDDYEVLKENTIELKHSADDFQMLFPKESQGGKAKKLIWEDKKLFDKYNEDFLYDINFMLVSINEKDSINLKQNFNNMASNCSSCHKKFKKKK